MQILLVEDDAEVARFVKKGLQEAGHIVEHVANGRDGLFMAASEPFDLLILDRMLPGGVDGLRIVETLRGQGNKTPVLFLTALGAVDDRVKGLKAGGDDYLVKPFAFAELLARIEALARRPAMEAPATRLAVADLEMDLLSRTVTRGGRKIGIVGVTSRSCLAWKACIVRAMSRRTSCAAMKSVAGIPRPETPHSSSAGSISFICSAGMRVRRLAFDARQMTSIAQAGSGKPGSARSTIAPACSSTSTARAISAAMRGSTTET